LSSSLVLYLVLRVVLARLLILPRTAAGVERHS